MRLSLNFITSVGCPLPNPKPEPILLAEIPSTDPDARIAVYLDVEGESRLQLCQQNWAEGIGWFTQSAVELQTDQLAALRQALGAGSVSVRTLARPAANAHAILRIVG